MRERESTGTSESRRLRREGLIPGVLYGRGKSPHAISIAETELRRVLTGEHGLHAILDVVLEGQKSSHASILKEFQRDPLKGRLIHVDLQEVRLDQPIQAQVSVELVGEAVGSKEGGVLSQISREVTVQALPLEMPDRLELDVSEMAIGDALRVSDLPMREGAEYLDDPETVIATVTMPTRIVEPEPEELEGVEEGEVPEGEEAPEGAAGAAGEPEAGAAGEPGTSEG